MPESESMPTHEKGSKRRPGILLILGVSLVIIVLVFVAVGRLRVYSVPTDGMKPAISRGDTVIMEGITYLLRSPRHGEIVIYRTDGLEEKTIGELFSQRVAGIPGDLLRISGGRLYVNDQLLPLANREGAITYANLPTSKYLASANQTATVPAGHYFLLGDNSTATLESRFLGFVPAQNIKGRIVLKQ